MGRIVIPRYQRQRAQLKQRPKGRGYFANGFGPQEMSLISKLTDLAVAGGGQIARAVQISNREKEQAEAQADYDRRLQSEIESRQKAAQAELGDRVGLAGPDGQVEAFFAQHPSQPPGPLSDYESLKIRTELTEPKDAIPYLSKAALVQPRGSRILGVDGLSPEDYAGLNTPIRIPQQFQLSPLSPHAGVGAPGLSGAPPGDRFVLDRPSQFRSTIQAGPVVGPDDEVVSTNLLAHQAGKVYGLTQPELRERLSTLVSKLEAKGDPARMERAARLRAVMGSDLLDRDAVMRAMMQDQGALAAAQMSGMPPLDRGLFEDQAAKIYGSSPEELAEKVGRLVGRLEETGDPARIDRARIIRSAVRPDGSVDRNRLVQIVAEGTPGVEGTGMPVSFTPDTSGRDFRQEALEAVGPAPERKLFRIADILAAAPSARTAEQRAMLLQAAADSPDIMAANLTDLAKGAYRDRAMQAVMKLFPEEEEALSELDMLRMQSMREGIETSNLRQQTLQAALDKEAAKLSRQAKRGGGTGKSSELMEQAAYLIKNYPKWKAREIDPERWRFNTGPFWNSTPSSLAIDGRNAGLRGRNIKELSSASKNMLAAERTAQAGVRIEQSQQRLNDSKAKADAAEARAASRLNISLQRLSADAEARAAKAAYASNVLAGMGEEDASAIYTAKMQSIADRIGAPAQQSDADAVVEAKRKELERRKKARKEGE